MATCVRTAGTYYEGVKDVGAMVIALGGMESVQRVATLREYEATTLLSRRRTRSTWPRSPSSTT